MIDETHDPVPVETQEWLESIDAVLEHDGRERMAYLLDRAIDHAQDEGVPVAAALSSPYVNTIPPEDEEPMPGDPELERLASALVRWNAMAIVLQANAESTELGGHIASYQSAETLYEVGFNHFWRGRAAEHGADLVFVQGHSSPGIYARAFLEGRLDENRLRRFRQEVDGHGLSSYPHPWLMPDFWQFPTVSMGLGPMMAIQQARFMKYMQARGLLDAGDRKVWAFMGDGEMDEPEATGALVLAGRERLDNLVFVVNCNLQRLDGPVRGNGKVIQELESDFRGAGWDVIKVIWGSGWDPLLAADEDGWLRYLMDECVDGEYQTFKAKDGAYVREHFFGRYPETRKLVESWTDEEIWALRRGGHDPVKVYNAYLRATRASGRPTVILAKTIKGFGMGEAGESRNITHQQKSMNDEARLAIRDRLGLALTDEQATGAFFHRPPEDSNELRYLLERRAALGGPLPERHSESDPLPVPEPFTSVLEGSGERENSTTMAFVRILNALVRDPVIGPRVVPIVPDESRTFGMEGMFRQLGIFSQVGQLYQPEDAEDFMFYREDQTGQILQEGINEAGAMASWIAAATAYANHGVTMVPFYVFYSMFGFQRIGDFAWAAGDSRARGFLIGGTSGRTTLNGEGLQHEDGHSHVIAATIPNCRAYDPTYGYELAVIVRDGMRRMMAEQEDVFYYLTVMNENYVHPPLPGGADVEEGILRGAYLLRDGTGDGPRVGLLGSGAILREVLAGAELLEADWGVSADVWSVTSFTELRREGLEVERWNRLHPTEEPRRAFVEQCFDGRTGPFVAATDYVRTFADQIRPFVPGRYVVLGTDGFGRSDYRRKLRSFFEVDRHHVAVAALKALADEGAVEPALVQQAIARYEIDPELAPPWTR